MLGVAQSELGKPYVFGAASGQDKSFDCSSYSQYVYQRSSGIALPRTAQQQYDVTKPVSTSDAQPGDLVFFQGTYDAGTPITHVAIFMGNGKFIGAQGQNVNIGDLSSPYWSAHFAGIRRVPGVNPGSSAFAALSDAASSANPPDTATSQHAGENLHSVGNFGDLPKNGPVTGGSASPAMPRVGRGFDNEGQPETYQPQPSENGQRPAPPEAYGQMPEPQGSRVSNTGAMDAGLSTALDVASGKYSMLHNTDVNSWNQGAVDDWLAREDARRAAAGRPPMTPEERDRETRMVAGGINAGLAFGMTAPEGGAATNLGKVGKIGVSAQPIPTSYELANKGSLAQFTDVVTGESRTGVVLKGADGNYYGHVGGEPRQVRDVIPAVMENGRPFVPPDARPIDTAPPAASALPKERPGFAGNIRLSKYEPDVQAGITARVAQDPAAAEAARRGVIPDATRHQMASQVPIEELIATHHPGKAYNAEQLDSIRVANDQALQDVVRLSGDATVEGKGAFLLAVDRQAQIQTMLHGGTAEWGRAGRVFREQVDRSLGLNLTPYVKAVEQATAQAEGAVKAFAKGLRRNGKNGTEKAALEELATEAEQIAVEARQAAAAHVRGAHTNGAVATAEVPPVAAEPGLGAGKGEGVGPGTGSPGLTKAQQAALERERIRQEFQTARAGTKLEETTRRQQMALQAAEDNRRAAQIVRDSEARLKEAQAQAAAEASRAETTAAREETKRQWQAEIQARKRDLAEARQKAQAAAALDKQRQQAQISGETARQKSLAAQQQTSDRQVKFQIESYKERLDQVTQRALAAVASDAQREAIRRMSAGVGGSPTWTAAWLKAANAIDRANVLRAAVPADTRARAIRVALEQIGAHKDVERLMGVLKEAIATGDPVMLAKLIRQSKQVGVFQHLQTLYAFNLLSDPVTHVRNVAGNTVALGTSVPETALAAGYDAIRSRLTGAPRERFFSEIPAQVTGWWAGLHDTGWSGFKNIMRHGFDVDELANLPDIRAEMPGGLKNPANIVFRGLSAADKLFSSMALGADIRVGAIRAAHAEGLRGEALVNRIKELTDTPTAAMLSHAETMAKYRTFRQEMDRVGRALTGVQDIPGGRFVVPFVRTPYNILRYELERSPLGLVSIGTDLAKGKLAAKGAGDLADRLGRFTLGVGVVYAANKLYDSGLITGGGPADSKMRAAWLQDHQPYSVKIGDRWVDYSQLQGIALNLAAVAAAREAMQQGDLSADQQAAAAFMGIVGSFSSRSFLQGWSQLVDAVSQGAKQGNLQVFARPVESIAQGMVPASSLLRRTQTGLDPTVYQANGIAERVQSGIPGAAAGVPALGVEPLRPRLDAVGQPLRRDTPTGFMGQVNAHLNPLRSQVDEQNPVTGELLTQGVAVPSAGKSIGGQALTADQQYRYEQVYKQTFAAKVAALEKDPGYRAKSDAEKQNLLEAAKTDAGREARAMVSSEVGIKPDHPPMYDVSVLNKKDRMKYSGPDGAYHLEQDIRAAVQVVSDYKQNPKSARKPTLDEENLAFIARRPRWRSPAYQAWAAAHKAEAKALNDLLDTLPTATDAVTAAP